MQTVYRSFKWFYRVGYRIKVNFNLMIAALKKKNRKRYVSTRIFEENLSLNIDVMYNFMLLGTIRHVVNISGSLHRKKSLLNGNLNLK